ncbi:kinesin-like protein KIF24 [Rhineura floridana]|uniref:kinesin-like protein KIF24 n=1 Tax=Rhineura floridana TaxID=261503 RepID=UPI002AC836A6|nr:kinesin-like protein KIF24 [Rhineura floridana]XP_061469244.1 kinesin-like protein KIF24 [Rhineura floridana]XP_061469251.1 kinesin-like protein KIF24 [Rhineura floridana]XP_061469255.1 kinesin-like protein KIF24 [Rhineura floridana]
MALCLYECLCEAELEKYFPHFTALGFQRIDELAKVSMKDYTKLGVRNMKDRKRLFQLIRIIKMLQAEEEAATGGKPQHFQAGALYLQPQVTTCGPRRQLHFDSLSGEKDGRKDHEPESCTLSNCSVNEDKNDLATALSRDSEYKRPRKDSLDAAATWTEHKRDIPGVSSSNDIAPLLGDTEAPVVQRVAHISGYNYGVPHSCIRPNTSEKGTPWTETDRIRVCVRKRPLCLREERRGEVNILTVEDKETLLLHEKKEAVDLTQYILQHVFYFDEVFGEACSNHDVYMKTAHPLIQHIFNGGNATCFAYGQTGAGKTYTMIGTHQNPGLYALAANDIFRQLEASPIRKDLHVWISFYEIYCGQLYDLLNGRKRLFAREDSKHIVQIVGLREVQVNTVGLLLEAILRGGKERSTGATGVNSDSSRSHAIIQIQIKDSANRVFGRISFIDLAGSERAADARDSDRQTKMEGAEINQSLLALKECIRALDQEHAHTPFRQSKLTQVLKDSFVGNSKTCMIANVSPSHIATEHTLNTLRYADRVKELKRGLKCCTPVASRRRTPGSMSPKRIQSSCSQGGEKSSPKKVKLGLQHPPTPLASRVKASPLLFHPLHPPFSSTPKGQARKGHFGAQWLGCTSPVKVLRAAPPGKKTTEDPTELHSGKSNIGKDFAARREGGQGDRQRIKCLRAQPVQKQLVSRADFSLGGTEPPSAHLEKGVRVFAEQCAAAWTSLPPHQKDREQHLRLYHQQFQQPPILQQKLDYQPLEKFLAQYKPQEIRVKPEPPCQTPVSPPQYHDEMMQLEDLEDSDFSEDSFSAGPSQEKPEVEAGGECSQGGSFFLHQRECGESWEVQGGQSLFFKPCGLENKGAAVPRAEEAVSFEEANNCHSDWSTEETPALDSSPKNDMPEKPYCSQDSIMCNRMSTKELLLGQKQLKCIDLPLSCPGECFPGPEKAAQSPPLAPPLGTLSCSADDLMGSRHGPLSGIAGKKHLQTGTDLCGTLDFSVDVAARGVSPLGVSLLSTGTTDRPEDDPSLQGQERALPKEGMVEEKPFSPRKQLDEGTRHLHGEELPPAPSLHEAGHWRRKADQVLSPQGNPKWHSQSCHSPKVSSPLGGASGLTEPYGCVCGYSPRDAGLVDLLSRHADSGDTLLLSNLQFSEYLASPQYDADTEATGIASLSCSGQFSLDEEGDSKPTTHLKHTDAMGKASISSALSNSHDAGNKEPSGESVTPWPSLGLGKLELGYSQKAFKLTFSGKKMGFLKNKFTQNMFTHMPSDDTEQDSRVASEGMNSKSPKTSLNSSSLQDLSQSSPQYKEALGRQFVLQIHQEQLDEMALLCFQEESLISKVSDLDFEDFVTQLDDILLLKSKSIHRLRTQLQPFLAAPASGTAPDHFLMQ